MATIVVIGAGIGGISQGYALRQQFGKARDIMLIGEADTFEFTPSNPWVALPPIPPRNTSWASRGKWVYVARVAYEKYFLHKLRAAKTMTEPYYKKAVLKMVGAMRLKSSRS